VALHPPALFPLSAHDRAAAAHLVLLLRLPSVDTDPTSAPRPSLAYLPSSPPKKSLSLHPLRSPGAGKQRLPLHQKLRVETAPDSSSIHMCLCTNTCSHMGSSRHASELRSIWNCVSVVSGQVDLGYGICCTLFIQTALEVPDVQDRGPRS